jgi:hypothetical protein
MPGRKRRCGKPITHSAPCGVSRAMPNDQPKAPQHQRKIEDQEKEIGAVPIASADQIDTTWASTTEIGSGAVRIPG